VVTTVALREAIGQRPAYHGNQLRPGLSPGGPSLGQDARQQINTARLIIVGFGNFGASGIESRHHESSVGIMWLETKFLRVAFLEIHNTEGIEPGGNFWLSCDIKEA
jgi:hypothetical protein